ERVAVVMGGTFEGVGGVQLMSPLKVIVKPVTEALVHLLPQGLPLLLLALLVLFVSLSQMVRMMRLIVMTRVEALFDRVLFRNDLAGFLLGWILTAIVQSSSAITSIVVPLVGTGVLSVRKIFPYTLGANLGTTVTAILAALAIGSPAGITVAFAHMVFNVFGIVLFYPLRNVPIALANGLGRVAARSQKSSAFIISVYIVAHGLPILYILLRNMPGR
ncbi:MAG: Na/Pi symporter, partial [Candidatus Eisenbacteria sp.]|nr:Na/Pi symporter [Candidatus Eisenbacteria bacterium]